MKISLNWLKRYIDLDLSPEEISEILTMIGLEVEGMEVVEEIKGGLKGVVVGEVLTCGQHPNADKLSVTTVNIGEGEPLNIVCGAPNVAAGQKVLVATVGTVLQIGEKELKIKKGKIRGEVSAGMICAEDELGLGDDHSGIMVLDEGAPVGVDAKDFLELDTDIVYEIGLTPNRSDATCHLGVAKDLAAYLIVNNDYPSDVKVPKVSDFKIDNYNRNIDVIVENHEACPRYSGVMISDIQVKESPEWLKKYLNAVDVRPINNVVDITNFILHELGQPLHAFDADKITGNKVIVKTLPEGTIFVTLDEVERKLSDHDLMICNGNEEGMCIGGVFGGIGTGVTDETKAIFLESAHFSASWIRKTSTKHLLRTDAAKVFEKGSDPNITVYALKRAAKLLQEYAGAKVVSDIIDIYPNKIEPKEVHVKYKNVRRLLGTDITKDEIHQILRAMDMHIEAVDADSIIVHVPTNKADVVREVDVIEEILRIYGFNKVPLHDELHTTISYSKPNNKYVLRNKLSDLLSAQGFSEMMGMSLIESEIIEKTGVVDKDHFVYINNTSNIHLDIMRPEMMVSGLLSVLHNHNRQNLQLKMYEFGKAYQQEGAGYAEKEFLAVYLSGMRYEESWRHSDNSKINFYDMKQVVHQVLARLGLTGYQISELNEDVKWAYGMKYHRGPQTMVKFGKVSADVSEELGLKSDVYYAEFDMEVIFNAKKGSFTVEEVSKFPAMRRDLAMIADEGISFDSIKKIAGSADKRIQEINLFDVYKNEEHIGKGKKSYAISLTFVDQQKTLKDKEVDKTMNKIIANLENKLAVEIRK